MFVEDKEQPSPMFKTLLTPETIEDIKHNPGEYVIITVYPK